MAAKPFLSSLFGRDPAELAEAYRREGKRDKAIEAYLKAGDWKQAGRLAIEMGDLKRAVAIFLEGALGSAAAAAYDGSQASQAGEVLLTSGYGEEALLLLEAGGGFRQAALLALKMKQPGRAAPHFERARDFDQAATYYAQVGRWNDALRMLEAEAERLRQGVRGQSEQTSLDARRAVDLRRAEILIKQGRGSEAVGLLRTWGLTKRAARLLEAAGQPAEAARAYLDSGEPKEALRLVGQAQGLEPALIARIYRETGHPAQAGRLFANRKLPKEAAEAFEAAGEWEQAAQQWTLAGDSLRAGQALTRAGRMHEAARSYEAAGESRQAATVYTRIGEAGAAGAALMKAGEFLAAARSFLAAGEKNAAAQALQRIPPTAPDFRDAVLALAPLLLEQNQAAEVLERLRLLPAAATVSNTTEVERTYWEGRALESLGRAEEAERCYRRVTIFDPSLRDATIRLTTIEKQRAAATHIAAPSPVADSYTPTLSVPAGGARARTAAPVAAEPRVGALFADRYEILAEIGRGGMGQVFKARDRELDDLVAIKTVLRHPGSDPTDEDRLVREIQICRKITHPNVVRVYDIGRVDHGLFFTMELLEGTPLEKLIGNQKQLSLARVKMISAELLAGLGEAHSLGIVHRDLKPGNIMVTPRHLKILDFGIARIEGSDQRLTRTGFAIGSPLYMSPEQIQGLDLDSRSDLYSFGVLLFILLTGREPFTGESAAGIILGHLQAPPPPLTPLRPDLSPSWERLVHYLLRKEPDDRPSSCAVVAEAIAGLPS